MIVMGFTENDFRYVTDSSPILQLPYIHMYIIYLYKLHRLHVAMVTCI